MSSLFELSQKKLLKRKFEEISGGEQDTEERKKEEKELRETGNVGARICLTGSVYQSLMDLSDPKTDHWKKYDHVAKKRKLIQDKGDDSNLEPNGRVLYDYINIFENSSGMKMPEEAKYYLSLSNDYCIGKLAQSHIYHSGIQLEDALTKGQITQNLYDLVIKYQNFDDDQKNQMVKGYTRHLGAVFLYHEHNYFSSNNVFTLFAKYAGMGHLICLSKFLKPGLGSKSWFLHIAGGSDGHSSQYHYLKTQGVKPKMVKRITFKTGFDFLNQEVYGEEQIHEEGVWWPV